MLRKPKPGEAVPTERTLPLLLLLQFETQAMLGSPDLTATFQAAKTLDGMTVKAFELMANLAMESPAKNSKGCLTETCHVWHEYG